MANKYKNHFSYKDYFLQLLFFICLVVFNLMIRQEQHHSFIAQSMLEGKTYFLSMPRSWADTVFFEGRYYWAEGPLPSILLIPFVYIWKNFNAFFYQGYIQPFLVFFIFAVIVDIFRRSKYTQDDAVYLAYAFCFSSVFVGVAMVPWSWYFSQVLAVAIIFSFLWIYLFKKNNWLLGILSGMLVLVRISAALIIFLPLLEILMKGIKKRRLDFSNVFRLIIPFSLFILMFFAYNYWRFGSFFEQGYLSAMVPETHVKARDYGMISVIHLPGNLYYMLLNAPQAVYKDNLSRVLAPPFIRADKWGMSLFITSPYLILLFFIKYRDRLSKLLIIVSGIVLLPSLLYYGIGASQFGYRYALDAFPLVFLLLFINYRKTHSRLTSKLKTVFIISSLFNFYLFLTLFTLAT